MSAQSIIDTRAIELAAEAAARIKSHEDTCLAIGERNEKTLTDVDGKVEKVDRKIEKVDGKVGKVHCRIDELFVQLTVMQTGSRKALVSGLLSGIGVLLTIVGYLLVSGLPWDK